MVTRASGYYRQPFQGSWGVTQGDPFYPSTFNVLVDLIVCHWAGIVAENKAIPDIFRYLVEYKADLLYSYDCLIASRNMVCLKWGSNVLIRIFKRVGIITNTDKTVVMVCQPGPIYGQYSDEAYGFRTTVKGYPRCLT